MSAGFSMKNVNHNVRKRNLLILLNIFGKVMTEQEKCTPPPHPTTKKKKKKKKNASDQSLHFFSFLGTFKLPIRYSHMDIFTKVRLRNTVNPLYTDTRYNDKIDYNDFDRHETVAQKVTIYQILCKNNLFNNSRNIWFGYVLESPRWDDSNKYPTMCSVKKYE